MDKFNHLSQLHNLNEHFKDHFANPQNQASETYLMKRESEMFQLRAFHFKNPLFQLKTQISSHLLLDLKMVHDINNLYQLEIKEKTKILQTSIKTISKHKAKASLERTK